MSISKRKNFLLSWSIYEFNLILNPTCGYGTTQVTLTEHYLTEKLCREKEEKLYKSTVLTRI